MCFEQKKCEQYFSELPGGTFEADTVVITTVSVVPYADFEIKKLTVKNVSGKRHAKSGALLTPLSSFPQSGALLTPLSSFPQSGALLTPLSSFPQTTEPDSEPLKITHYHYTSWPDHGVPQFATSIISFVRRVQKSHDKSKGVPLLVHCSAGVGRTGTFIMLDAMTERLRTEDSINIYSYLMDMRKRRTLMVQTEVSHHAQGATSASTSLHLHLLKPQDQYVFIHNALPLPSNPLPHLTSRTSMCSSMMPSPSPPNPSPQHLTSGPVCVHS